MARITKDPEVRRNELMDIAEQLFVENGYDHTSASDIIRRSGIAQGTFYYYFKSKDDIVRAIIDRYLAQYEKYIDQVAGDNALDAIQKLLLISEGMFNLASQKKKFGEHACIEMKINNHEDYHQHFQAKIIPIIQKIVRQGIDEGLFTVEYPDETAEMLVVLNQHLNHELMYQNDSGIRRKKIEAAGAMMEKALNVREGTFRS